MSAISTDKKLPLSSFHDRINIGWKSFCNRNCQLSSSSWSNIQQRSTLVDLVDEAKCHFEKNVVHFTTTNQRKKIMNQLTLLPLYPFHLAIGRKRRHGTRHGSTLSHPTFHKHLWYICWNGPLAMVKFEPQNEHSSIFEKSLPETSPSTSKSTCTTMALIGFTSDTYDLSSSEKVTFIVENWWAPVMIDILGWFELCV